MASANRPFLTLQHKLSQRILMTKNGWKWCCLSILTIATLAATGCKTYGPDVDEAEINRLARIPYPAQASYGDDLDVVIVYKSHYFRPADIQMINREPRELGPGQLWINQQYVADLAEPIRIGPDNTITLTKFINYYREPFPVGLFFNPDSSEPVVLTELYDPATDLRHRLYVQKPSLKATLD